MNKLLAANFSRMKKDKIFWIGMAFMLCLGIFTNILYYKQNILYPESPLYLDNGFFVPAMFIGIVASVFCSLFIGTEYSDGTIRNKIIVGHPRAAVYLSNLAVCIAACILMCLTFTVVYTIIGYFHLGWLKTDIKAIFIFFIAMLMIAVANCAIFTLITMLNQNKAISAVVCILLAFGMLFAGSYIKSMLDEPEIYDAYTYVDNAGRIVTDEAEINPNYVGGTKRKVYEFINDFLPGGQAIQTSNMSAPKPEIFILYSSVILVITTGAGILIFRKKDLK